MLVVFPIALWMFSLISDFAFLLGGDERWNDVAFYTMAGGLVGALLAAVPGLFDMFSISDPVSWFMFTEWAFNSNLGGNVPPKSDKRFQPSWGNSGCQN